MDVSKYVLSEDGSAYTWEDSARQEYGAHGVWSGIEVATPVMHGQFGGLATMLELRKALLSRFQQCEIDLRRHKFVTDSRGQTFRLYMVAADLGDTSILRTEDELRILWDGDLDVIRHRERLRRLVPDKYVKTLATKFRRPDPWLTRSWMGPGRA